MAPTTRKSRLGSVSQVRGRWRTQVRDNDGRRRSADDVLGRAPQTYETEAEARAVMQQAVDHLNGRVRIVTLTVAQLDEIHDALTTTQRQLVEAQAAIAGLRAHLQTLNPR